MSSAQDGWRPSAPPKCIQMDEGGDWKNEIWTDLSAERRAKLRFQGVGAHPWLLERRSGLASGIYNRLVEDDRPPNETILSEAQWRLNTLLSISGFSAYQLVSESNPVGLLVFLAGKMGMGTCCLRRTPPLQDNLRNSGNYGRGPRRRP